MGPGGDRDACRGAPGSRAPWQPALASASARLALRCLQGSLCLAYLGSGLARSRGNDWYTGDAIHRALTLPLYRTIDASWMVEHAWVARLLGWGTLGLEIGYPVIMGWSRTRRAAVVAVLGMHAGIGLLMQLHSFSAVMGLLTLVAFGLDAEAGAAAGGTAAGAAGAP